MAIFLLRHGEPVGGTRYRGSTDDPLSDLGWRQMNNTIGQFRDWQTIVSSPLLRCYRFAQQLSASLDIPLQIENHLSEIHFGDWEGQTAEKLWLNDRINFDNFLANPLTFTPPNGETLSLFSRRVLSTWENLIVNLSKQENMLLICHGGSIRVILAHVLGMPLHSIMKIHVPFASVSKILLDYRDKQNPQCRLASINTMICERS